MNSGRTGIYFYALLYFLEQAFVYNCRNSAFKNYILETVFAYVFAVGEHTAHVVIAKRFGVRLLAGLLFHTHGHTHAASVHIGNNRFNHFTVGKSLEYLTHKRGFAFIYLQVLFVIKIISERSNTAV